MYCLICLERSSGILPGLCETCENKINPGITTKHLYSLQDYAGVYRQLFLFAKMQGNYLSKRVLLQRAETHRHTLYLFEWADEVLCIPSSMFTYKNNCKRLHAELVYRKWRKKAIPPPRSLLFHRKQQSLNIEKENVIQALMAELECRSSVQGRKNILLVDDLITTGTSLLKVLRKLPPAPTKVLTLANKPHLILP